MQLRDYQEKLYTGIHKSWDAGNKNAMGVAPTGTGKTVLFSHVIKNENLGSAVIAHRNSLVVQISRSLNRNEVPHRLIAQPSVIREACKIHIKETGKSSYDPSAKCGVSSLKTLLSRSHSLQNWVRQVGLWVTDEAHHLLKENQWGKGVDLFKNARGLGVTATPCRADGRGLGSNNHGVFDDMVVGATQRDMTLQGWLVEPELYAPPSDVDYSSISVNKSGDYSKNKLRAVEVKSQIVGDVVQHYLRLAKNKLGVTFASNIETATEITADFNKHGVPARLVHANTPEIERFEIERLFKNREILQMVNVDLFGEGYDLPELEVVSFARKTDSFSLFVQQCGRVLRPSYHPMMPLDTVEQRLDAIAASHKPRGIIIDHVGNIRRHGRPRYCDVTGELFTDLCLANWSLDPRERRSKRDPDLIPSTICVNCTGEYPGVKRECPYCGFESEPANRSAPEHVDGDLELLTPEALAKIVGVVEAAKKSPLQVQQEYLHYGFGPVIAKSQAIRQHRLLGVHIDLGKAIDMWGGWQEFKGRTYSESYRLFYYRFGIDILSARGLNEKQAKQLNSDLRAYLNSQGVQV